MFKELSLLYTESYILLCVLFLISVTLLHASYIFFARLNTLHFECGTLWVTYGILESHLDSVVPR